MELFILAGPNGSGKSTLITHLIKKLELKDYEYINPDLYASSFFSYIENEKDRYIKAFEFAEQVRRDCLEKNKKMIIETVNSTLTKFDFYKSCKEKNYKITVVFVSTSDPQINIKRVDKRKAEGGHYVPANKIVSRYYKSLENLYFLSLYSDILYIYDNSGDKLKTCVYKDKYENYISDDIPKWLRQYYIEPLKNNSRK